MDTYYSIPSLAARLNMNFGIIDRGCPLSMGWLQGTMWYHLVFFSQHLILFYLSVTKSSSSHLLFWEPIHVLSTLNFYVFLEVSILVFSHLSWNLPEQTLLPLWPALSGSHILHSSYNFVHIFTQVHGTRYVSMRMCLSCNGKGLWPDAWLALTILAFRTALKTWLSPLMLGLGYVSFKREN